MQLDKDTVFEKHQNDPFNSPKAALNAALDLAEGNDKLKIGN